MKEINRHRKMEYVTPSSTKYEIQSSSCILAGSVTDTPITFTGEQAITVHEYDKGFDNADGFGTINF